MTANLELSIVDCLAIFEVVKLDPGLTTKVIAQRFPSTARQQTYIRLKWLRKAGHIESRGPRNAMTWHPCPPTSSS